MVTLSAVLLLVDALPKPLTPAADAAPPELFFFFFLANRACLARHFGADNTLRDENATVCDSLDSEMARKRADDALMVLDNNFCCHHQVPVGSCHVEGTPRAQANLILIILT